MISSFLNNSGQTITIESDEYITGINIGQNWTLTVSGASGTFTVTAPGGSATFPIGVDPATLQAGMEAISGIGAGNVTASGWYPYKLTFVNPINSLSVDTSGLVGTRAADPSTPGTTAADLIYSSVRVGSWPRAFANVIGGQYYTNPGDGDSSAYVKLTKSGFATGNYRFYLSWVGGAGYATNVAVRIYDGTTLRRVVYVDQTQACPYEWNPYVPSKSIGDVYISSGTVVFVVANECNGALDVSELAWVPSATPDSQPFTAPVVGVASLVGVPGYKVNGGTVTPFPYRPVWDVSGYQKYAVMPISETLSGSDVVRVVLPAGALVTTSGPSGDLDLAATNNVGISLCGNFDPSLTRPFKLGFNVGGASYFDAHQTFSDLMRACPKLIPYSGLGPLVLNDNGEVVSGGGKIVLRTYSNNAIDPLGYANVPTGTYILRWTGAGSLALQDGPTLISDDGTVGGMRQRKYSVSADDGKVGCTFSVEIIGPVYSPQVYPPGTSTDGSQTFFPNYASHSAQAKVLRSMTIFGGVYHSIIDISDFSTDTQISWGDADTFAQDINITSVVNYPNGDGFYPPTGYMPTLVRLASNHNFEEMTMLTFSGPGGGPLTIPLVGGGSVDINFYTFAIHYNPATMAANEFAIGIQVAGSVSGTATPGGNVRRYRRYCPPVSKFIELCNLSNADAWLNIPHISPCSRVDTTWTAVFRQVARTLALGKTCYCEFGNEPWNSAFPAFHYWYQLKYSLGTTTAGAYASFASHFRSLGRNAFAAEGRDPNQFKLVYNSWAGVPSFTQDLAAYCAAHSLPIDYVALAPYWYLVPELQSGLDATYNALNTQQVLDVAEWCQARGIDPVRQNADQHMAYLLQNGFTDARLCCYELGPAYARLGGTNTNQAYHSQGCVRDPRFHGIMSAYWKEQQNNGHQFGVVYTQEGPYGQEGGAASTALYNTYFGSNCVPGYGANNRNDPWTVWNKESVVGQSIVDWNAAPVVPPVPVYPNVTPPRYFGVPRPRAVRRFV